MFWTDINPAKVEHCLDGYRQGENPLSAKTANYYLQAARQFVRWGIQRRITSENPLACLKPLKINKGEAIKRRAMTVEEIQKLLATTKKSEKTINNLTGKERFLIYLTAILTGYRRKELRLLKVSDFDFERGLLTVRGEITKSKKESVLPLSPELVENLRPFCENKLPNASVFDIPGHRHESEMIRADLLAAGINPDDTGAGKICFHSTRHSFASILASCGVSPRNAMDLLRHSDFRTTYNVYCHSFVGQLEDAIAKLPSLTAELKQESQKKTGTYDTITPPEMPEKNFAKSLAKTREKTTISANINGHMAENQNGSKTAFLNEKPCFFGKNGTAEGGN